MKEGWHNEDYFILFESQAEAMDASTLYGLSDYLPDHYIIGLRGWDDFIVSDIQSNFFIVPTVPLSQDERQPFTFSSESLILEADAKLSGKIKWYVKPLVFGGSAIEEGNIIWITQKEHAELVRWWNKKYNEIKNKA